MNVHNVEKYKACATSAMRNASNGEDLIQKIKKEAGIDIEIIDGKKEAKIIASTDLSQLIEGHKSYLYVDVGGGSTEFTVFSKKKVVASKSFKLGTVRLLNKEIDKKDYLLCTCIDRCGNILTITEGNCTSSYENIFIEYHSIITNLSKQFDYVFFKY